MVTTQNRFLMTKVWFVSAGNALYNLDTVFLFLPLSLPSSLFPFPPSFCSFFFPPPSLLLFWVLTFFSPFFFLSHDPTGEKLGETCFHLRAGVSEYSSVLFQILAPQLINCMMLNKLPHFLCLSFSIYKMRMVKLSTQLDFVRSQWVNLYKVLRIGISTI